MHVAIDYANLAAALDSVLVDLLDNRPNRVDAVGKP